MNLEVSESCRRKRVMPIHIMIRSTGIFQVKVPEQVCEGIVQFRKC